MLQTGLKVSRFLLLNAFEIIMVMYNKRDIIVFWGVNTLLSYWPVSNVYEKLCFNKLEFEREVLDLMKPSL